MQRPFRAWAWMEGHPALWLRRDNIKTEGIKKRKEDKCRQEMLWRGTSSTQFYRKISFTPNWAETPARTTITSPEAVGISSTHQAAPEPGSDP